MHLFTWIVSVLVTAAALSNHACRAEDGEPTLVRRHVLGFYDGLQPNFYRVDRVHEFIEMPANYLGLILLRHDIREGPPDESIVSKCRGVITFFSDEKAKTPDWIFEWLEHTRHRKDFRFVHMGGFGPLMMPDGRDDIFPLTRWLSHFDLDYREPRLHSPVGLHVAFLREDAIPYEANPLFECTLVGPSSRLSSNELWVELSSPLVPADVRHPVVTGPWGGLALSPFVLRWGGEFEDRRWYLDPFTFLRDAMGMEGIPAPDPAVMMGRRVFFVHVDGDGFESISTVKRGQLCAQVFLEEILRRYDLPFTVSVIVRSLTDDFELPHPTEEMDLARQILNLDNVEPASHGILHPLDWRSKEKPHRAPRQVAWYSRMKNYDYSPLNEVTESIGFINKHLLDQGTRCELFLWSGLANPTEEVVRACADLGCWNLNGGGFRFDAINPSVGYVTPMGRRLGNELQIYAPQPNENIYEGFFEDMPRAFRHVDQTIDLTGRDRILKAVNLYLHFYSAERPTRLESARWLIEKWGHQNTVIPVHASTYAKATQSALSTASIVKTQDGFQCVDFGHCRSVRIDHEPRSIDMTKSWGVLGYRHLRDSLFVHLSGEHARIVFTKNPQPYPYFVESNHELKEVTLGVTSMRFVSEAIQSREFTVAGFLSSQPLRVLISGVEQEAQADSMGRLRVTLPARGRDVIEIRGS